MKVLVVSDNHKDEASLEELIYIYEDESVDLWLHAGDSEFGADHAVWETFKTVKGNMDWENEFPLVRVETTAEKPFVLLHGHKHQAKYSRDSMAKVAKENDAHIVFYGHTHVAKVDTKDGIFFINPGSIAQPRGNLRKGSYAIYEQNEEGEWIRFYDWNHNELTELSQKLVWF